MLKSNKKTLRLILGDQLNIKHSWFSEVDENVTYVMMEMRQETDYVTHHIQKIVAFFLAMRNFAEELVARGHQVVYLKLDDEQNLQSLTKNLQVLLKTSGSHSFEYMQPDEYRVSEQLSEFCHKQKLPTRCVDSEHFYLHHTELTEYFTADRAHIMENFYRKLRKRFDVLMDGNKPEGNKWNYDKENRKKLPKKHIPVSPKTFSHDVREIVELLEEKDVQTVGRIDAEHFIWPVTREESLELFDFFLVECLPQFGLYQDAMSNNFWSIYHSRISFALNSKLIDPMEVVQKAELHWRQNQDVISLAQVEGFIRQILGWREYMRGMYWINMPEFSEKNHFNHQRPLPEFFWTGETKMQCLKVSIQQSLDYAYAHHIQRLMLTGNYMLLTETHPDAADEWYLGIYIDALEWVEMPNTRGMSQFADGGLIATKPYISSANYINKMGDHCSRCAFDRKERLGVKACPFNSLYWRFLHKNQETLRKNMRMRYSFVTLDKMSEQDIDNLYHQAENYLL